MSTVHLLSATGDRGRALRCLHDSATNDPFGIHRLTEHPEEADLFLFVASRDVGPSLRNIRHHPLYRRFRKRCFAYSEYDFIVPLVPGIYPSVHRRWNVGGRARGGPYLSWFGAGRDVSPPTHIAPSYLFSFVGAARHAGVRRDLLGLKHEAAWLRDTSQWYAHQQRTFEARQAYRQQYTDSIEQSRFVLCPRGLGASSVRLFDVMRMGRVPVILSDAWLAPEGPDWQRFSIRVPERQAHTLPEVLEARADEAAAMGRRARAAWETWFHSDVHFHRFTEACLSIARARTLPEPVARPLSATQFVLHPSTAKTCVWRMLHGTGEQRFTA